MNGAAVAEARVGRWWLWVAAALALALGVWVYARRAQVASAPEAGPAAAGAHAVAVATVAARKGDLPIHLAGIGTVVPLATVTVRSRVDGQLMEIHFREGYTVQRGDLLAEIDPRPFAVQLAQAEGQLASNQAQLANAKADLARFGPLAKQGIIARQQLDAQQALVRQFEGAVAVDRGHIDDARLQLTYTRITAPIGGRLGLRLVDTGNMVRATDAGGLVVITQMTPISVVFSIPEDSLPALLDKLHAGERPRVEAFDRDGTRLLASGTLLTTDNQIDPATGTVRLKAEFANDEGTLFPNQFVNARLVLDVRREATLVPSVAVRRGTQGAFVYVVKDDHTVAMRPVRIDVAEGDDVAVADGLAAGDVVVVDGADALRDGSHVTLRPSPAAPPPARAER